MMSAAMRSGRCLALAATFAYIASEKVGYEAVGIGRNGASHT